MAKAAGRRKTSHKNRNLGRLVFILLLGMTVGGAFTIYNVIDILTTEPHIPPDIELPETIPSRGAPTIKPDAPGNSSFDPVGGGDKERLEPSVATPASYDDETPDIIDALEIEETDLSAEPFIENGEKDGEEGFGYTGLPALEKQLRDERECRDRIENTIMWLNDEREKTLKTLRAEFVGKPKKWRVGDYQIGDGLAEGIIVRLRIDHDSRFDWPAGMSFDEARRKLKYCRNKAWYRVTQLEAQVKDMRKRMAQTNRESKHDDVLRESNER